MHPCRKKLPVILLLSFAVFTVQAQDTSWTIVKADKVFSLAMPGDFVQTKTFDTSEGEITKSVELSTGNGFITMRMVTNPSVQKMKDQKEIVLQSVENNLKEQGRQLGFTPIFSDTIVSNVKGLKGVLYNEDDIRKLGYFFLVEGKLYSIIYTKDTSSGANYYPDFQRILNSMHFSSPEARDTGGFVSLAQTFPQKSDSDFSGGLIVCIILAVMIVVGLFYRKRRN
jgi:hypothetical protein